MTQWKMTTAAALASLTFVAPAFAQATTGSPATGTETKGEQPKVARDSRKGGMAIGGDEKVKAAQQALKDKGHDPGTVDGKMGPRTQAALHDFQKAQGMQATGRLDSKTVQSLGMDGAKSSASPATTTDAPKGAADEKKTEEKKY